MRCRIFLFLFLASLVPGLVRAADPVAAVEPHPVRDPNWKWSLAPLIASQTLDIASSYGMRELNPALAGPDGRFGMRAAGIKISVTGAIVGVEYLIVKFHPRAARALTKLNWSGSAVTAGFAAHNFAIR